MVGTSKAPLFFAEIDGGLIDTGVAAVGNDGLGVGQLAVGAPHLSRGADGGWHGGIDDDVAGHVQVGDALVRVDHGHRRAGFRKQPLSASISAFGRRAGKSDLGGLHVANTVVGIDAEFVEAWWNRHASRRHPCKKTTRHMAKDDGVGDLHHGGFHRSQGSQSLYPGVREWRPGRMEALTLGSLMILACGCGEFPKFC